MSYLDDWLNEQKRAEEMRMQRAAYSRLAEQPNAYSGWSSPTNPLQQFRENVGLAPSAAAPGTGVLKAPDLPNAAGTPGYGVLQSNQMTPTNVQAAAGLNTAPNWLALAQFAGNFANSRAELPAPPMLAEAPAPAPQPINGGRLILPRRETEIKNRRNRKKAGLLEI